MKTIDYKLSILIATLLCAPLWAQSGMLCEREIKVSPLTKSVIYLTPFRGVNLVFPFEVSRSNARFNMSSNRVFKYNPTKNRGNIVHLAFDEFDTSKEGEVTDFNISTDDYIFSLRLVPTLNEQKHCSDVLFTLSEEEKIAHQKKETNRHLESLKQEYKIKFESLDTEAENRVLKLITGITQNKPKKVNIKETGVLELSNKDAVEAYVDRIKRYGKFSLLEFIIENDTADTLRIEKITVFDDVKKRSIDGFVEIGGQMESDSERAMVFASRELIPETGVKMTFETTKGDFELYW